MSNLDKKQLKKEYDKRYRETHRTEASASRKKYYENHKEKELIYNKKYREDNIDLIKNRKYHHRSNSRFSMLKSRAKKRNLECSITYEQFLEFILNPCYYCNFQLCKPIIAGCGLDRIDSSKGYVEGNVVSCGKICNVIKNEHLTSEETKAAVKVILEIRNREKL